MTAHAEGSFVGPRRRLRVLPAEDMERIHEASLDVLEAHGAVVDRETTAARIPQAAVEEALKTLPAGFTLGGRTPEFDLPLDGEHVYLTSDGCATFVRDADGTVRPRAKQDVYDAARVVDGLHEFDACMRASRKHSIVVSIKDATEARPLIRMAEAVTGGSAELKARPTFSVILCTVSPLHQERFGMELAFALAMASAARAPQALPRVAPGAVA